VELTAITRGRYLNDVRRALAEFLTYYLALDHSALWENVGGSVDVYFDFPALPPGAALQRPRVMIGATRDEVDQTFLSSGQSLYHGEYHNLTMALHCITDDSTGATLTATDIASSVHLCFADHRQDLETLGLNIQSRLAEDVVYDSDAGLYSRDVEVQASLQVLGAVVRTLELELGRFVVQGTGQGQFQAGVTLSAPHSLKLHLLTGTGVVPSIVTVYAVTAGGQTRALTASVSPTRSAGIDILIPPAVSEEEYVQVTSMTIGPTSGAAGEVFAVHNIPEVIV